MLQAVFNIFKIPELRNRVMFTIGILVVYRLGFWVPLVGVDQTIIAERRFGGFSRIVQFAEAVKADEMAAKLEDGLLRIIAPKKTVTARQAVNITIEE